MKFTLHHSITKSILVILSQIKNIYLEHLKLLPVNNYPVPRKEVTTRSKPSLGLYKSPIPRNLPFLTRCCDSVLLENYKSPNKIFLIHCSKKKLTIFNNRQIHGTCMRLMQLYYVWCNYYSIGQRKH